MARSDPQLNFRVPQELRDRLEQAAGANKRSLTAELIDRLQRSFEQGDRPVDGSLIPSDAVIAVIRRNTIELRAATVSRERQEAIREYTFQRQLLEDMKKTGSNAKALAEQQTRVDIIAKHWSQLEEQLEALRSDAQGLADRVRKVPGLGELVDSIGPW